MATLLFLAAFFGLLSCGMPIFLVLGILAAGLFFLSGQPLVGVAQVVVDHLNSQSLMSLPLFVMAAAFMRRGGVAQALVGLATAWLGGIRGSLGLVTVVACTLFAAICGSSVATALAMGTILLPAMIEKGYPRSFALGVIGASGTIGIVIPVASVSWNASVPIRFERTCPVMQTIGVESIQASAIAVTRFVAPGPEVARATPTLPEARA